MDGGKVGADTVEGVLHLQQGLAAAAWDLPVKVVSLLVLCMHGQERRLTLAHRAEEEVPLLKETSYLIRSHQSTSPRRLMLRPSSDADGWSLKPRRRRCS
jgi:hypothetical protein